MGEGDFQRSFETELLPLSYEDSKIDDLERLFAITSAKLNASSMLDEESYEPEEFDEISNFAQFKLDNPEYFEGNVRNATQRDTSFYMIPKYVKINGKKTKCKAIIDSNGNGLYIILPDGTAIPSNELRELTGIQTFVEAGVLTDEEAQMLLKGGQDVNEIGDMIQNDELDIVLIGEKAKAMVKAKGLDPEKILKEARERDLPEDKKKEEETSLEEQSEQKEEKEEQKELSEQELEDAAKEDAERAGISFDILQIIAAQKGCKVHQIRFRELYRHDIIQERIGKKFEEHKGNLGIARISYGFREEMIIIDKTTGNILHDDRRNDHELEDLVPKWPHGTRMPIKKDEGRSYISYINKDGVVKETKFLNNGKYIDMAKDERERFIVEVQAINKELSEAISQYEKNNTMDNWKKVRDAMAKRVAVDRKYDVLKNQREVTGMTLISALLETIGEVGAPKDLREREKKEIVKDTREIDDEDPRLSSRHRDPRWD